MVSPVIVEAGNHITLPSGQRLHYAQAGTPGSPLVIFLHGFPQAWFAWEAQMALSGATHFCVAPDMRGFNLSGKPGDLKDYRIDRLVNDIVQLIESLGYAQADLIAHDWGGAVAWSVAIARPDVLKKLMILNAPHPVTFARALASDAGQQKASQYMLALRKPDAENRLLADNCAALLRHFKSPRDRWLTPAVADRYRAAWTEPGSLTGALAYYRASPLMPPTPEHPGAAGLSLDPSDFKVTVPTTVLWGLDDSALLPVLLEGLDELVDQFQLIELAQASHWLVHEQPDQVAAHIEKFLKD
ncbi:MAG: alpha/beta fold hydrolase [Burkholderiaceae bacterium]